MTGPLSRAEAFRREAEDCLGALAPLLDADAPRVEELRRLARVLRGAALLSGPEAYARAVVALEGVLRAVLTGDPRWSALARQLREPLERFRALAAAATRWDARHDREAEALGLRLRSLADAEPAGRGVWPSAPAGAAEAGRAHLAREVAALAGRCDATAAATAAAGRPPPTHLRDLRSALLPLRGLAAVADHPPLPELLDALELLVADWTRFPVAPVGTASLLEAAARTLAACARGIAGSTGAEQREEAIARFAAGARAALSGPGAVTPVETLLAPGAGSVQPYGPGGEGPTPADPMEVASLGDHLRLAATQLRASPTGPARSLRALVVAATLRAAPGGLGRRPAGAFLARILAVLDGPPDGAAMARLPDVLDQGGQLLAGGARSDLLALARDLDDIAFGLPPAVPEPPPTLGSVVPIQDLLEDEPVPIESLAPEPLWTEGVPADRTALERSLSAYSRLVRTAAPVAPLARALAHRPAAVPEESVVPVESLCYSGPAALARAEEVRRELEEALRSASRQLDRVEPLVRELLDLVPLALGQRG